MLTPLVLQTERLSADEVGIDKCHLVGIFHCEINILGMTEGNFIVIRILERHLIAAEMRKDIIPAIFPGAGSIEDIGELIDQR